MENIMPSEQPSSQTSSQTSFPKKTDISRRNMLLGAAAMTATVTTAMASGNVFASSHGEHMHDHGNKNEALIDAAMDCLKKGDLCTDHCIELVKTGDTSIADCLASVSDMEPMCKALAKLAANQSPHLTELVAVCISVCETCEKECRKHEKKHAQCKACADSCADCIKECKKLTA
jgi:Cys-rich four helix bundle protein (predicted Tat secretion target)